MPIRSPDHARHDLHVGNRGVLVERECAQNQRQYQREYQDENKKPSHTTSRDSRDSASELRRSPFMGVNDLGAGGSSRPALHRDQAAHDVSFEPSHGE